MLIPLRYIGTNIDTLREIWHIAMWNYWSEMVMNTNKSCFWMSKMTAGDPFFLQKLNIIHVYWSERVRNGNKAVYRLPNWQSLAKMEIKANNNDFSLSQMSASKHLTKCHKTERWNFFYLKWGRNVNKSNFWTSKSHFDFFWHTYWW